MFPWDEREILRYLGYRGQELSEDMRGMLAECEQELEQAAAPKCFWREYPLTVRDGVLDMTVLRTESRALARNLGGCKKVIIFGATLGRRVDMLLGRYSRLQMSRAVVLSAASAAMLETYCDEQNERIKEQYFREGWYLRPRFSPGYGDFPLECQREVAAALELSKRIGITLTDSLLMLPSKSVTAVIGVSREPAGCSVKGCEACVKKDCLYRR